MSAPGTSMVTTALAQRIESLARQRGAAGAQYAVLRHGALWLEHCHGLSDAHQRKQVTPATTFNAYSIAKTLTAATVVALAARGKLDLDSPMGKAAHVEGLEAYGSVRETLLHRAGFRNPNPLRWTHPAEQHESFDEAAFAHMRANALQGSSRRRAGNGYSNLGYLLLGLAIEHAWGGPFVQAVQAIGIEPLSLSSDDRLGFSITHPNEHACGHIRRHSLLDWMLGIFVDRSALVRGVDDNWVQLRPRQVNGSAYGGLIANARGLARFGQAFIDGDCGWPLNIRRQMNDVVPGPGPQRSLVWFQGALHGQAWLAHAGGGLAGYGEVRVYPTLGAVSALLTNGAGFTDAHCLDDIDSSWIEASIQSA